MSGKNDGSKVQSLLTEYQTLATSTNVYVRTMVQFISIKISLWVILVIIAYVFVQPILFLVATAILVLLIWECGPVVAMGFGASVRMSEIEEEINRIIGEDLLGFQLRYGIYLNMRGDIIAEKILMYFTRFMWGSAFIVLSIGLFSLFNGLSWLYNINSLIAFIVGIGFGATLTVTVYYAQGFMLGRHWEKFRSVQ